MIEELSSRKFSDDDLKFVKKILVNYRSQMFKCECYKKMHHEIDEIETGPYTKMKGGFVLVRRLSKKEQNEDEENVFAGIICCRRFSENECEMKRLYVRKRYRRKGIALELVKRLIVQSRNLGYKRLILNVGNSSKAVGLYKNNGFKKIDAYPTNCSIPGGCQYFAFDLQEK